MQYNFPIHEWYSELDLLKRYPDLWSDIKAYSRGVEGDLAMMTLCRRRFSADELPEFACHYLRQQGVPLKAELEIPDRQGAVVDIIVPQIPLIQTIPQIVPIVSPEQQAIRELMLAEEQNSIEAVRRRLEGGWSL